MFYMKSLEICCCWRWFIAHGPISWWIQWRFGQSAVQRSTRHSTSPARSTGCHVQVVAWTRQSQAAWDVPGISAFSDWMRIYLLRIYIMWMDLMRIVWDTENGDESIILWLVMERIIWKKRWDLGGIIWYPFFRPSLMGQWINEGLSKSKKFGKLRSPAPTQATAAWQFWRWQVGWTGYILRSKLRD